MKRLLTLLLLLLAFGAEGQTSYTQMTLTVNGIPTNGMTVSVNGHLRTWTNNVTAANVQIPTTNSVGASATNYWVALISYPETGLSVAFQSSNQLVLTAYAGFSLSVSTNAGAGAPSWLSWTTNSVTLTNATVFRYPTNGIGLDEASNAANALVGFLNSPYDTNAVNSTLPQWSNFVSAASLAALSNYVGLVSTNATNFTKACGTAITNLIDLVGLNNTNYASNLVWNLTNNSPGGYVWNALNYFTNQFALIGGYTGYHDPANITGNVNSILLTNESGIKRMVATANGGTIGAPWDFYESDGSTEWMRDDLQSGGTFQIWDDRGSGAPNSRLEIDNHTRANGPTWLRGPNGNDTLKEMPVSDVVHLWTQGSFDHATVPAVMMGTVSNFPPVTDSGDADYNTVVFSGSTFTNQGDTMIRTTGIKLTATGSYQIAVQFQGNAVITSPSITTTGAAYMSLTCEVTAGTGGNYYWNCKGQASGAIASPPEFVLVGTGTLATGGGNPTNSAIDVIADGSTGDTIIYVDNVRIAPASSYAYQP